MRITSKPNTAMRSSSQYTEHKTISMKNDHSQSVSQMTQTFLQATVQLETKEYNCNGYCPISETRNVGSVCCTAVLHNFSPTYGHKLEEAQLLLTNPCDAFRGQSRSLKVVPLDRVGMVSY